MYPVTQDFLDQMRATERRVYAKAEISYTDPFLDQSIQCTANEQANVSYPQQTADAVAEPFAKIAALDGAWVLGQDWALAPGPDEADTKQMGWWGSQLAGADGSFTTPYPTLTVTFFSRPITQLKVVGDSKRGEYPVDFVIKLYDASDTVLYTETVTNNNSVTWQKILTNPITQVVKMTLEISRWSHAGRQVKILEFFTSIQEVYEGDDILLIHLLEEREVSQGSLPVGNISANEIDIRLNNASRKFDAGNKQSPLYQLLKQNRRIKAWLGLKGDGEGTNLQQSVDFTQGTLNNLVVVNNKLQLPSVAAPTFTRNSIAYKSDGTLVNTNLPRYEAGKFGKAVMVEEGTTNLVTNGNFSNGLNGWSANQNVTLSLEQEENKWWCKVVTNQDTSTPGLKQASTFAVSSNTDYTISFEIYGSSTDIEKIKLYIYGNNSGCWLINAYPINATTNKRRFYYTFNTGNNTAIQIFILWISPSTLGSWFKITDIQIESKPYSTSYVNGTRSPETLTIPTAGVLNDRGTWTIECWAKTNVASGSFRMPFSAWNKFYISLSPDNRPLLSWVDENNTQRTAYAASALAKPTDWHYWVFTWDGTIARVYVDAVKVIEVATDLPKVLPIYLDIGRLNTNNYYWNGLIDDLRISNRARTDTEIAQAYASGLPLPVDEWTTYKLGFDGNLNFGQGGYYLSPEFDLSAVGTAATSAISWQEDNDGIQRTVYAKLDNQVDWTQVQNGGKLPITEGDVLTGRKLQLKAKLIKLA